MMFNTKKLLISVSVAAALTFTACTASNETSTPKTQITKQNSVLESYTNIALNTYSDTLNDAKALQKAINTFALNPSEKTLQDAKDAWLVSRESYGQTEASRLSNGPIDAEDNWISETYGALEGQLNAWPLDENMIDYTIDANGTKTSGNIIDTAGNFNPGGEDASSVNVSKITVDAITALNENGGDANVATGYHAIEFLLWGQDQDYSNFLKDGITKGALKAGNRPLSDFISDKNAQRRLDYLQVAVSKIVADLEVIKGAWENEIKGNNGLYKAALLGKLSGANKDKNISQNDALKQIISGLGVFIKSELANERIAVAVLTPSEEDEHSCFSDNTHRDIAMNYQGFKNILTATYNGEKYGASLLDKVDEKTKEKIESLMISIESRIAKIDETAKTKEHFDYQIKPDSIYAKNIVKLKNQMRKLGDMMVQVAIANNISLTTDDVTDAEETKFKRKPKLNILSNIIKTSGLTAFLAVGLFASQNIDENYLKQPVENLSYSDYDKFILGKSFFIIPWVPSPSSTTARDGLGPLFNANTCVSCHPKNGRGVLFTKDNLTSRSLVARLSLENIKKDEKIISKKGFISEPIYGSQIAINGTVNTKYEAKIKLDFKEVEVKFPDGEIVKLLKPNYSLENLNYGKLHKNTNITYRIANSLNGMGLIEQIPNEQILVNEDIDDKNNDGISGKANRVYSKITKKEEIGRFTHKSSVAFLSEQIANAANEDMGLTSNINPNDNCTKIQKECLKESKLSTDTDIPNFRIEALSFYIKNLKTYSAKKDVEYLKGLELFENLGCAKCHISSFTLKDGKQIAPFSDFLLHDMGEVLSDGRVEFDALKSEFRTAPLWGLFLHEKINGKKPRLLHDGRARTFQEAILWHGGEAENAKSNYMNLEKTQRKKLIEFLEKL